VSGRPSLNWEEAGALLSATSSERELARRLTEERQARGWSQERLAREVTAVGVPLPQSAISKIEKPAPGGRRAITVQEAIGFSIVFDVPLLELLLPANARDQVQDLRAFAEGPGRRRHMDLAVDTYWGRVRRVAWKCHLKVDWWERVEEALALAQSAAISDSDALSFYTDVLAAAHAMNDKTQAWIAEHAQASKANK